MFSAASEFVDFDDDETCDEGCDAEIVGCGVNVCACLLLLGRVCRLEDECALCDEDDAG